ncbi:MAG: adenine phosphoribosyltransferase [Alphaproteobacteria bacterium GM202ARS2]|nr:adenine phosphoribosyltransferase [Alphaproteobacteria bacterium GM202ARS2]
MSTAADRLKRHFRLVPDFPKPGIVFYDIAPLLVDPDVWQTTLESLAPLVRAYDGSVLAGIEARGFLLAAGLAHLLHCGVIMVRKKNKLPGNVTRHTYDLEYGSDCIEVQNDMVAAGTKVVVVDDVLATGGTLKASVKLLTSIGLEVRGAVALLELTSLRGRSNVTCPLSTLIQVAE